MAKKWKILLLLLVLSTLLTGCNMPTLDQLYCITKRHSADKGIHYCVDEHVGIRVTEKPEGVRYLNTAEDKAAPLYKLMDVVSVTYSETAHFSLLLSISSAYSTSPACVIFIFSLPVSVQ